MLAKTKNFEAVKQENTNYASCRALEKDRQRIKNYSNSLSSFRHGVNEGFIDYKNTQDQVQNQARNSLQQKFDELHNKKLGLLPNLKLPRQPNKSALKRNLDIDGDKTADFINKSVKISGLSIQKFSKRKHLYNLRRETENDMTFTKAL
mmetsp:Transcript_23555/g.20909  ORF Transcript_23555/g.20909 Transcript_23555/m.20909 type:complete len:149 (-) Transcript_23555:322-768(-)